MEDTKNLEEKVKEVFDNSIIIQQLTKKMSQFIDDVRFLLSLAFIPNDIKVTLIESMTETISKVFKEELNPDEDKGV